jgi:hypothetical protein
MKRRALGLGLSFAVSFVLAGFAPVSVHAGGSDIEGMDEDDHLPSMFGDVRDVNGYRPLEGARIQAQAKGAPLPMMATTDVDGRFKLSGFAKNVDPEAMKITCSLNGYRLLNLSRRKLGKDMDAPVEVECLLEKE